MWVGAIYFWCAWMRRHVISNFAVAIVLGEPEQQNAWKLLSSHSFKYLSTSTVFQNNSEHRSSACQSFNFKSFLCVDKMTGKDARLFLVVLISLLKISLLHYVMRRWLTEKVKDFQRLVFQFYNFEEWILCAFRFLGLPSIRSLKWQVTDNHRILRI